ncbi:MAG: sulfatase-like hydrolase/transferase [Planctomycetota bacterium]
MCAQPSDHWTRRRFLKTTASLPAAALGGPAHAAPERSDARPNVLVIVTDQQHAGMMSGTGNPWLKTPAMDGLAARGTRFDRTYATNPVCVPSRFSLWTGHYASRVGVRHNGDKAGPELGEFTKRSLGHVFRRAGYDTVYGGKVHLPGGFNNIGSHGFRVLTGNDREGLPDSCKDYFRQPRDKPFLMVASFINPHDSCYMAIRAHDPDSGLAKQTPRPMLDAMELPDGLSHRAFFADHCPPLPNNFEPTDHEPGSVDYLLRERPFRRHVREKWTTEDWRLHRWAYCRLTERVDAQIGRLLAALDQSGERDNTLIVFTSDHGDMDGSHRLEHKTVFYEESSRVPLIVCPPQNGPVDRDVQSDAHGRVDSTHLVSNGLDLLPTLCDYAGIQPPKGLSGRSVRALAEGQTPRDWREHAVIENQVGYMIHDGRYKYARYEAGRVRDLLVDLKTDPGEMKNLAKDRETHAVRNDLRQRLKRELARRGIR